VQHLKAYASQDPLNQDCIDPRYNLVSPKGKAPNVEDLGGKWAVPGYDVNKYRDFETALLNNDTYGQYIVNMVNRIKDISTNILPPPETPAKIKEVKGNNIGYKGVDYTITANATSPDGVEYKYWLADRETNEWKLLKDYSELNSYTWKPDKVGKYRLVVHVRGKNSTKKYDDYGYKDIEVKVLPPAKMIGIKASSIGCVGQDYIMIANATGANGVEYRYWLNDKQTNEWKLLRDYSEFNSYTWKPDKVGKYRLVVHVRDKSSIKEYDDYAYKDVEANNYILYNKTIMLDPGHGGSWPNGNPGSVNNNLNIAEKDLNNSLTKRIAKKLTDLGAKVIYTRLPDKEIDPSLEKRAQLVNEKKPDLFLSIHHDGSTNKSASGISTHYSSYRPGIETKDAYVIYKGKKYPFVKEVKNWSGGNSGIMYLENGVKVTRRINDVMVYDSTPSDAAVKSKKFAEDLFKSIYSLGFSKNSYIKDHNLYMTRWTNVPSVLLEAGFVTNDKEVLRISNPTFQDKIAEKAVEAIKKFFSY
ncbi:MAG: N-acetylmuramoyl-L-alanine amidase, partial [Clostridiaceae bacterium]|nr:N-acetylmuramoyl-L-alanine amidase [Clostridiaceae bacterium]